MGADEDMDSHTQPVGTTPWWRIGWAVLVPIVVHVVRDLVLEGASSLLWPAIAERIDSKCQTALVVAAIVVLLAVLAWLEIRQARPRQRWEPSVGHTGYMIDREDAVQAFRDMLENHRTSVLQITGVAKMGKSHLMREFRAIATEDAGARCVLIDFRSPLDNNIGVLDAVVEGLGSGHFGRYRKARDQSMGQRGRAGDGVLKRLAALWSESGTKGEDGRERQTRRLTSALVDDMRVLPGVHCMVLLFDAVDDASESVRKWLVSDLIRRLHTVPQVCVALAGRELPAADSVWSGASRTYVLERVSRDDFAAYLRHQKLRVRKRWVRELHRKLDGRPGLLVDQSPAIRAMGR